jgi:hypothetical protein
MKQVQVSSFFSSFTSLIPANEGFKRNRDQDQNDRISENLVISEVDAGEIDGTSDRFRCLGEIFGHDEHFDAETGGLQECREKSIFRKRKKDVTDPADHSLLIEVVDVEIRMVDRLDAIERSLEEKREKS